MNTTLNTLLNRRNHEYIAIRAEFADKTAKTVLPLLEQAHQQSSGSTKECMNTARINFLDFFTNHSQEALVTAKLALRELEVIHSIKQKQPSKEIAELLDLSVRTIKYCRENIRKNLRLVNRRRNLGTFLKSTPGYGEISVKQRLGAVLLLPLFLDYFCQYGSYSSNRHGSQSDLCGRQGYQGRW